MSRNSRPIPMHRLRARPILVCAVIAGFIWMPSPSRSEPTSYLPVTHRAYDFLERMEHTFPEARAALGTKPATRADIARQLFGLAKLRGYITAAEKEEFECLLAEFSDDFLTAGSRQWGDPGPVERLPDFLEEILYRNRRNLYSARGDDFSLYLDPVVIRSARLGKLHGSTGDDNVYTSTNGFILRGTVGDHIGYHIDVRDSREWGSRDYPGNTATTLPGRGFASFKGDSAEFDETNAHVTYAGGPFVVSLGRGKNVWGRGRSGTLIISEYGAPCDMLRVETSFWKLRFTFFTAELEQFPPIAGWYYSSPPGIPADSVAVKKYMSGHRLELNLGDRLQLGLHETVVFGGRWDLTYLNPVMFLKGGEHANGDHDNAAMGADFRLFLSRTHSLYGELLIDDITTTKLGTDWYGNKLAWQVGTFIREPFGLLDFDARLEYAHVNPWVYTHRFPINSYTHYGDVIGHRIGPNADEVYFEIRKRFSRRLKTAVYFTGVRHGANTAGENVGGDPLAGFKPGDSKEVHFLDGDLEKTNTYGFDLSYEILWQLFIRAGYERETFNGDGINRFSLTIGLNE